MLELLFTNQFKKDFKNIRKLPLKDLKVVFDLISKLENRVKLEAKFKDHDLTGNYIGYRECHIKPDLLLIYKANETQLFLIRIGSHSELFG
jgi:mRNA interferase YafQ